MLQKPSHRNPLTAIFSLPYNLIKDKILSINSLHEENKQMYKHMNISFQLNLMWLKGTEHQNKNCIV